MERAKVKDICGVLLNRNSALVLILLTAIICVLSCIIVTGYAKTNVRTTLFNTAASCPVLNESKIELGQSGKWQSVRMSVTAYCPCRKCCGKYSDGITACGHEIRPGDVFVAADRKYPFGTEMIIAGYKNGQVVKVLDRGGAIYGNRLDVFFDSHERALKWGVRHLNVKVRLK